MKVLTILMFTLHTNPSPSFYPAISKPTNYKYPRSGQLTLIEDVGNTTLANFIENNHPNGERIEAGLLELGEQLLATVTEFIPNLTFSLGQTFFPDTAEESPDFLGEM